MNNIGPAVCRRRSRWMVIPSDENSRVVDSLTRVYDNETCGHF